jgi:hypothetical protein
MPSETLQMRAKRLKAMADEADAQTRLCEMGIYLDPMMSVDLSSHKATKAEKPTLSIGRWAVGISLTLLAVAVGVGIYFIIS